MRYHVDSKKLQDLTQVEVAFLEKYRGMSLHFAQSRQFTLLTKISQAVASRSTEFFTNAIVEYDTGACLGRWYQIMFLRIKQQITEITKQL